MTVFIGVFEGCEEQRFWKRTDDGIEATPGRSLEAGDILSLGVQAIHAINAPIGQPARAVHVYLGDIYDVERSVFHPGSLVEHAMTSERYDEFCRASVGTPHS
jgi:predicted metal-dependent enzyme (double-stranded beta helix superfamily)